MTVPELVARPVETVQGLYQRAGCPTVSDSDFGVVPHFKDAVAAIGVHEIPCLSDQTVERLPHHSLVRFRGMVQDLLNPEYYVGAFQRPNGEWVTTKFSDPDMAELDNLDSSGQPIVWERRPIVCVPLPGLSNWAFPADATATGASMLGEQSSEQPGDPSQVSAQPETNRAAKRERSFDADMLLDANAERGGVTGPGSSPAAPQLDQEDSMQDTDLADDQGPVVAAAATSVDTAEEDVTRPRIRRREDIRSSAPGAEAVPSGQEEAAGPAVGREDVPGEAAAGESWSAAREVPGSCMVYLYDNAPALVLHEVVEIIGVVSHVPQLAALEYDNRDAELEHDLASLELTGGAGAAGAEQVGGAAPAGAGERLVLESMRAAHPPTSKVMRLHAILVRRNPPLVSEPPCRVSEPMTNPAETPVAAGGSAPSEGSPAGPLQQLGAAPPVSLRPIVASLRDCALGLLRWALGGDAVAAEYVLLQLLGRVVARGDPASLGQITLNLCRCPSASAPAATAPSSGASGLPAGYAVSHSRPPLAAERLPHGPGPLCAALHAAISCLVPLSVALPLSVESCNSVSWAPQRDPVRERTRPALLQLAPGTIVLLDETLMAPGQLKAEGVVSMQALMAVSRQQELMYDFETFQHPVPVDLPLIVLTEGRSLLRDSVHVRVPLNATQPLPAAEQILAAVNGAALSSTTAAAGSAQPGAVGAAARAGSDGFTSVPSSENAPAGISDLAVVRSYLAVARAQEGYDMADEMATILEQYFVDARRSEVAGGNTAQAGAGQGGGGGGVLTAEEFHTKLTLARLLVRSYGENRLTRERWQQLLQLEHTREARLRVVS